MRDRKRAVFMPDEVASPCETNDELARRFNRTAAAVRKWRRMDSWPDGVPRDPPWETEHVVKIGLFVSQLRTNNPLGASAPGHHARASADLQRERALYTRLQRRILAKKYHDAGKCQRRIIGCIHAVGAALSALAESLPDELASVPRQLQTEHLHKRFDQLRMTFANGCGGDDRDNDLDLEGAAGLVAAPEVEAKPVGRKASKAKPKRQRKARAVAK